MIQNNKKTENYSTTDLYLCELLIQRVNDFQYYPVRLESPKYILAYKKYNFYDTFSLDPYYKNLFNDNKYRHYNEYKAHDGDIVVMPLTAITPIVHEPEISHADAVKILNSANNNSKNLILENFKNLAKKYPEEAKKIAMEILIETGVLDENGNSKEQIVTEQHYSNPKRIKIKLKN